MRKKVLFMIGALVLFASCTCDNQSGGLTDFDEVEDKSGNVNVIEQAKPAIMIIPSDQCLQKGGFMKKQVLNGREVFDRDYNNFLLNNDTNKAVVRAIQSFFISQNYPLTDLEQTLKSLNEQSNLDMADGVAKDAKTLLVSTCKPDIILELDLAEKTEMVTRTTGKKVSSFTMTALDPFSNKAVSTFSKNDIEGSIESYMNESFKQEGRSFMGQISNYFKDIVRNGREITFRILVDQNCLVNLSDDFNDMGDTYSDWIRQWLKTNAKNGAANMQRNTDKEMYFTNVRITNLADDGTQFNAYDFATSFRKAFIQTFHMKCQNTTQGLGDASVIIK